jgi:hypothetical protein
MSRRKANRRPSMAQVPIDFPVGIDPDMVQRAAVCVTDALLALRPRPNDRESIVALALVMRMCAVNARLSAAQIEELGRLSVACAVQADDQFRESFS